MPIKAVKDLKQFANVTFLCRVPIQTSFGRRPVLIFSTIICLVSNIWRAVAKDYRSFMGACILNGIGAGPAEVGSKPNVKAYLDLCLCCSIRPLNPP